jgi:inosine/xanthosine triphosphatase
MKLLVASQNPVKLAAVQLGFEDLFPNINPDLVGLSVPSGVSDQPKTEKETYQGAFNRVQAAKEQRPEADFWIGIEGGIEDWGDKMAAFAWVVIADKERIGEARSATFFLPDPVAELIREGMELGEADDRIFGAENSKQNQGAIGLLTHNAITRKTLYVHPVIMAFIPFIRPEYYG